MRKNITGDAVNEFLDLEKAKGKLKEYKDVFDHPHLNEDEKKAEIKNDLKKMMSDHFGYDDIPEFAEDYEKAIGKSLDDDLESILNNSL